MKSINKLFLIILTIGFYQITVCGICSLRISIPSQKKTTATYRFESKNFSQIITISEVSDSKIKFHIITQNLSNKQKKEIIGEAELKDKMNLESDEDETGISYTAKEYWYRYSSCIILIRIADGKKDKLKLNTLNCYSFLGNEEGFFSLNVLLKRIE